MLQPTTIMRYHSLADCDKVFKLIITGAVSILGKQIFNVQISTVD